MAFLQIAISMMLCATINAQQSCQTKQDLIFVVDSSGSIRKNEVGGVNRWDKVLDFMAKVVDLYEIGPDATRVGCVLFGNKGHMKFSLSDHTTKPAVVAAIRGLRHLDQNTNTSGGLRVMNDTLLYGKGGNRPSVPDIVLVITDGVSTRDNASTVPSADNIKNANPDVTIISVGVTNKTNPKELRGIASDEDQAGFQTVYEVKDFDALAGLISNFRTSCLAVKTVCKHIEDVILVVDSSGSIRKNEKESNRWEMVLEFLWKIINMYDIGENLTRVGCVMFSNTGEEIFNLLAHTDRKSLFDAVHGLRHMDGNTNTSGGLKVMRDAMLRGGGKGGNRPDVHDTVYVMTDGMSTYDKNETLPVAQQIKADNPDADIVVIGVTDKINRTELEGIASYDQNGDSNVELVKTFEDLVSLEERLARKCKGNN